MSTLTPPDMTSGASGSPASRPDAAPPEQPAGRLMALYRPLLGTEIHCGPWLTIDQQRIDLFAEATGDHQWIHCDPERAQRESPYGSTIAHGYLTLSLLPLLTESNAPGFFERTYPGMRLRVNYGLDRLRFPAPVRVGSRVRARTVLKGLEQVGEAVQFTYLLTVEIEGGGQAGLRGGVPGPGLSMSACPKCGYPAGPQESTCPRCGVIFARIRDGHAAPRPPVAELPETRGRSGSCLLAAAPDQSGVQLAGKALVLLVLAVWGLRLASQPIAGNAVGSSVLHLINLPFHEAGHVFFSPLGRLLQVLGGSLGQLIIPGIVIAAFLRQRQPFSASVGLWWLGESLLDLAPYIDDARAGQLVLLGGVPGSEVEDYHDWEVILTRLGLMQYDHALARCAWVLGTLLILAALSWGGWIMTREYRLRKRPPF